MLEVGTGLGYQAAVLGHIVQQVHTIEILEPLCEGARTNLADLGIDNVHVHCGDGYRGLPDHAPFDGILVAAAPDHVPQALTEQLAVGAKLVIPVGPQIRGQDLLVITRTDAGLEHATIAPVRFVPMTGEAQDPNAR